jgi:hypothetical protein
MMLQKATISDDIDIESQSGAYVLNRYTENSYFYFLLLL